MTDFDADFDLPYDRLLDLKLGELPVTSSVACHHATASGQAMPVRAN
jgi:hypothetical protein